MHSISNTLPDVSVVMPVYNGGHFLVDAIASVLSQSFSSWELVCVNDGSTDDSPKILDAFAKLDGRIRVIHQENLGIVDALNRGCQAARAELICRMDCDDISLPYRLARQVEYMHTHPTCCVVGAGILEIDANNNRLAITRLAAKHNDILHNLLHRKTGHFHPTTLFRRAAFEAAGRYRKSFEWIEDHDLWLRMSSHGHLANMPEVLLCYRQHASSVCWQRSQQQRELMNSLLFREYAKRELGPPPTDLILAGKSRSQAGPGKWARAAAKGGFPLSSIKLLGKLWKSKAALPYQCRMTAEVVLRLLAGLPRAMRNDAPQVPKFLPWHERLQVQLAAPNRQVA